MTVGRGPPSPPRDPFTEIPLSLNVLIQSNYEAIQPVQTFKSVANGNLERVSNHRPTDFPLEVLVLPWLTNDSPEYAAFDQIVVCLSDSAEVDEAIHLWSYPSITKQIK